MLASVVEPVYIRMPRRSFHRRLCQTSLLFAIVGSTSGQTLCNLTGTWQSVGADDPISVVQTGATFLATAQNGWTNESGTVFPNATAWFGCCGGMYGSISGNCSVIEWHDAHSDVWARHVQGGTLSTGPLTIGVQVPSDGATAAVTTFFFAAAGANTSNLPPTLGDGDARAGGTLTLLGGADAASAPLLPRCSSSSCAIATGSSSLNVSGLTLAAPGLGGGVFATEDWAFSSPNASAILWTVTRTYGPAAATSPLLAASFIGLTLVTTGGLPIHSQQIPSYADAAMFYNASSTGGFDMRNSFFEYLSPRVRQAVRFSPTGALFSVDASGSTTSSGGGSPLELFFAYSKPFADGTAWCSLGVESVDRRGPGRTVAPGDVETITLSFVLVADDVPVPPGVTDPFPVMDVTLPNATLSKQVRVVAAGAGCRGLSVVENIVCCRSRPWWPSSIS